MRTPFEESLAAALEKRMTGGERSLPAADLALDQLAIDLPANSTALDHGELAEAIATALDDLLREPR